MLPKILIYGYGNPGRQDDGLGVKLIAEVEVWAKEHGYQNIDFDANYQLNIEDSVIMSDKDLVIFADASREEIEAFEFTEIVPDMAISFTSHHVSPSYLLYLCEKIYQRKPRSYLLHIKGYEWNFLSEISGKALKNFDLALNFMKDYLKSISTE